MPTRNAVAFACLFAFAVTLVGCGDSSRGAVSWQDEFTQDVAGFREVAEERAGLLKAYPTLGEQFSAFDIYAGKLQAESRQLEALDPPIGCSALQEGTVELLLRLSRFSEGVGDAKNLTPTEFRRARAELGEASSRLSEAAEGADRC